jgi:hypothetical protein
MRVQPFHAIKDVADCRPASLVRFVRSSNPSRDNGIALVVETEDRSLTHLLFLGATPDKVAFRKARSPLSVIAYRDYQYRFMVDHDKAEFPAHSSGDPPSGTLLLQGDQWFISVLTGKDKEAYQIATGRCVNLPDLATAAAFRSWKLALPLPETEQFLDLLSFSAIAPAVVGGGRRP